MTKMKIESSLLKWVLIFSVLIAASCQNTGEETKEAAAILNDDAYESAHYSDGGDKAFIQQIAKNLKAKNLHEKKILTDSAFKLYVEVVINKKGEIGNLEILNAANNGKLADAVFQAILATEKWKPAQNEANKPVAVKLIVPLRFEGKTASFSGETNTACLNIVMENSTIFGGFENGNILMIPANGCTGCVNSALNVLTDVKEDSYPEGNLFGVITGDLSEKEMAIFIESLPIDKDRIYIDFDQKLYKYMADKYYPLLIDVKDSQSTNCTVLQAGNINYQLEELVKKLVKDQAYRRLVSK